MARLHIHIAVSDLEVSERFYSTLFNHAPTTRKDDYAKWELDDPAVNFAISRRGSRTGLDHVGLQARDGAELDAIQARLTRAGIAGRAQPGASCCYAHSDKYWTRDPQGIAWETFHTLDSIPTFNGTDQPEASEGCCVPAITVAFDRP
jgi:catechol 2,3-dioxygenase-like lactoylglutathione lyase family enzyme